MPTPEFHPRQHLELIDQMIRQARNRFTENGFLYLLWGWLILASALGHYLLIRFPLFGHPELIWSSCGIAMLVQFVYLSRKGKTETVKTYSDDIIQYIWTAFGISLFLMMLITARHGNWSLMYALLLMLYGIPTFLTGVVMQFRPLKTGGIICWILAAVTGFIEGPEILLMVALAVIAAWIIPGYGMRRKYQKEQST